MQKNKIFKIIISAILLCLFIFIVRLLTKPENNLGLILTQNGFNLSPNSSTGTQGPQGERGPQGDPGTQGDPGPQGDPGTKGAAIDQDNYPPALGADEAINNYCNGEAVTAGGKEWKFVDCKVGERSGKMYARLDWPLFGVDGKKEWRCYHETVLDINNINFIGRPKGGYNTDSRYCTRNSEIVSIIQEYAKI